MESRARTSGSPLIFHITYGFRLSARLSTSSELSAVGASLPHELSASSPPWLLVVCDLPATAPQNACQRDMRPVGRDDACTIAACDMPNATKLSSSRCVICRQRLGFILAVCDLKTATKLPSSRCAICRMRLNLRPRGVRPVECASRCATWPMRLNFRPRGVRSVERDSTFLFAMCDLSCATNPSPGRVWWCC